jgi:hypothetical protein
LPKKKKKNSTFNIKSHPDPKKSQNQPNTHPPNTNSPLLNPTQPNNNNKKKKKTVSLLFVNPTHTLPALSMNHSNVRPATSSKNSKF